ncbi:hypothetical protein [Sediminicola luteus]|uniref:Nucleotide-diphospho-sugar transferase domain-containing protein n=1 Tax=Sediminicola luteus TaxID=319238 RepID=A0ABV2TXR7_9FLAO
MDYISTWFCADKEGEESNYAQTGEKSSSKKHQDIYWRCIVVFFISSKYQNPSKKHLLFTNVNKLPNVDGIDLNVLFQKLEIEIVYAAYKYKTPIGYYGAWRNQFYIFSVLEYIADNFKLESNFLILDSDCVITKSTDSLFNDARLNGGFLSYIVEYGEQHVVNGISRRDMKIIYEDLYGGIISHVPEYHGGEFFLANVVNITQIYKDFVNLWPILLERHNKEKIKFNEEAHTLSFLYFKNNLQGGGANSHIKRIWTNPVFYRNVLKDDVLLTIWHIPAEKTVGFKYLFGKFKDLDFNLTENKFEFKKLISKQFGIPNLTLGHKLMYYSLAYKKAIRKRLNF